MRASFAFLSIGSLWLGALGAACNGQVVGPASAPSDAGASSVEAGSATDAATTSVEAGPVDPGPPRCTKPRPASPQDDDAGAPDAGGDAGYFARHPWPTVVRQGGPVLASPHLVPIVFDGDPFADDLDRFTASVGCTDYYRATVNEYGVGDAIAGALTRLDEPSPSRITSDEIERWLVRELTQKSPRLERPTKDALYIIYYGPGTEVEQGPGVLSCQAFGGYHTNVVLPDGTPVAYAVVPRCDGMGDSTLDTTTSAASHEIVEAVTDPYNKENPAFAYVDDAHASWMFVLGGEVSDLCAQRSDADYTPEGYPYAVQRSWSNRAARRGEDPCVPASGEKLFTAAFTLPDTVDLGDGFFGRGVVVPAGESRTLDLELHDEGAGSMLVDVTDASSMLGHAGHSTLTLDKTSGKSGDVLKLTIKAPAGVSSEPELFTVALSKGGRYTYADVGAIGH